MACPLHPQQNNNFLSVRLAIKEQMSAMQPEGNPLNQVVSSNVSEPNSSKYVAQAKKLISRRMLIGIQDGRFFLGSFYCMDKQGNIILQDAVEYRSTRRSSPSPMEHRGVGLVLIPFACRTSSHVDCSIEEQLSLLSLKEHK